MRGDEAAPIPFEVVADGLRVAVRVTPKASRSALGGVASDAGGRPVLEVRIAAAPVEGAANAALVKLLAKAWRLPARRITITAGVRSRHKMVHLAGDGAALLRTVLASVP